MDVNNMLFCGGVPAIPRAIPVCQQGQSKRCLCLLPDFCVCFLIFPPFPDFFFHSVSHFFLLLLTILNAVRNSGAYGYRAYSAPFAP